MNLFRVVKVWVSPPPINVLTSQTASYILKNIIHRLPLPSHNFGKKRQKQPLGGLSTCYQKSDGNLPMFDMSPQCQSSQWEVPILRKGRLKCSNLKWSKSQTSLSPQHFGENWGFLTTFFSTQGVLCITDISQHSLVSKT